MSSGRVDPERVDPEIVMRHPKEEPTGAPATGTETAIPKAVLCPISAPFRYHTALLPGTIMDRSRTPIAHYTGYFSVHHLFNWHQDAAKTASACLLVVLAY